MRLSKTVVLLLSILVLAFSLRIYRVTEVPPSLNWDEVSIGYNAYSILKTGRDEWGEFMPLHFKSYGEYKLPVQIYASIPAIAIFGLNDFSIRLTPVIYGTLTVLLAFFIGMLLFNRNVGLFSSFLLAISPWHLQLTRASFEASFATFWISLGVTLFLLGLKTKRYLYFSLIAFLVSVYTYNSARVFTPLFIGLIFLLHYRFFLQHLKQTILLIALGVVLLAPLVPFVLNGGAGARYKLVSITDDPGLVLRINEHRGNSTLPAPLPRLIHNKVTYISFYFTVNYLAHFSPQFLFIKGAPHHQHGVQGNGEFYIWEAPFMFFGLLMLFQTKNKWRYFLVGWVLLTYIPVSITQDSIPHALRSVISLPSYQLITGFGLWQAGLWWRKKYPGQSLQMIGSVSLVTIVLICFGYYLYRYYVIYPIAYSRDWQYGNKQVVQYIQQNYSNYDMIVYSRTYGEPHMFTLFYLSYDPAQYQNNPNLVRFETNDWVWVTRFDKFYFPDLGDPGTRYDDIKRQFPNSKLLFIGKPGDFPASAKVLQTVNFLNGRGAFEIVE
jgi:4-amino-4-deoxy-L-arabinose transferase-like glycosyltransferase